MKKFLTVLLVAVLSLCTVFGLTGCNKKNSGTVNPRTGTIVVGYTDYAPMNYNDKGVFKGFDTELAIMTFNALGYNVKFKLIKWANKYVELNQGTIDCIWNGFTSNGKDDIGGVKVPRRDSVAFTYDYMENAQCIIRLKSTQAVDAWADFAGKSIAFETGSAGQSLVESKTENIQVMPLGKTAQMDAVTAVNMGSADYAIVDLRLAQEICSSSAYSGITINEGITIDVEYYAVGFKKGSNLTAKVNVMLKAFYETGYLTTLATKYGLENSIIEPRQGI